MQNHPADQINAKTPTEEEVQAARLLRTANFVLVAVLVLGFAVLGLFFGWFHDAQLSHKPEHWGQTGDFIGGIVNPTVGLGTVVLIFIGLRIQRAELKATTAQLEKSNRQAKIQGFEQSLFSWLANYRSLLADVSSGPDRDGRRALEDWFNQYFTGARARLRNFTVQMQPVTLMESKVFLLDKVNEAKTSEADQNELGDIFLAAREGYMTMFDDHRLQLDAVLRTLFRLFQWIDEQKLSRDQKWHYAALVRAQLSWIELAYLLYNACSVEGAPFAEYVNRYALLDNLVGGPDPLIKVITSTSLVQTSKALEAATPTFLWPLDAEAFSSDLAKPKYLNGVD